MKKHLNTTPKLGKLFYQNFHNKGKIVMLNLLKFKAKADYSNLESLKPAKDISGKEAYQLYMKYTQPILEKFGSKVLFGGNSKDYLIGPETEGWDLVLLVEHESVAKFMEFAQNEDYLKTAGHRMAALEDSRLLPIRKQETD